MGRAKDAIAAYRKAIEIDKNLAVIHYGLAMALKQQGEFHEALKAMRRAHELPYSELNWPSESAQWVRELERLVELDERLPDFISGKTKPASPEQGVELAELCARKQRNLAAARFYTEAFTPLSPRTAPLLRSHRYNAACAAALAGCGQGKDVDKLDDKKRTRLRRLALDWLRADLDAWGPLLAQQPGKARPDIGQAMQHWLADTDFAGVRGPEALAKLPEAERQPWEELWKDVAEMLKRARAKATPERTPTAN
jgi:tetratricopeptide (TPR) repeat protein